MDSFENVEHLAILLGVIATAVGLIKGLRAWQSARDEAIAARTRQDDTLKAIAAEFQPRNGRTLAHTVTDIDHAVKDHCAKADVWFADNHAAHQEIHRRIDGLFEMLGGPGTGQPRKLAQWHAAQRARDEEG